MQERREPLPAAVLVAVQLPGVSDEDHAADIRELGRLVRTLGYEVVGTVTQRRNSLAAAAVLGEGKLKELAELTGGTGVVPSGAKEKKNKARARFKDEGHEGEDQEAEDEEEGPNSEEIDSNSTEMDDGAGAPGRKPTVVVVDHEITPSQARNLERATGAGVLDRTGVIIEIFHRHARSRE
ncbi:MAG: GTPase HflX, partial [Polyangiaceae bacterium]|nr:GTPase HflX [Polyangiaceae bacterium]